MCDARPLGNERYSDVKYADGQQAIVAVDGRGAPVKREV